LEHLVESLRAQAVMLHLSERKGLVMDRDIKNAQQRLVLSSEDYTGVLAFSPLMLARLEHVLLNNTMPPSLYLSMHWNAGLTSDKKEPIFTWIASERATHPWRKDAVAPYKGEPVQPLPNTSDPEKVALGGKLFHETLLSGDNSLSCESCHDLNKGGTDQSKVAKGIRGRQGLINSATVLTQCPAVCWSVFLMQNRVRLT